jgi:peroxiredoxin
MMEVAWPLEREQPRAARNVAVDPHRARRGTTERREGSMGSVRWMGIAASIVIAAAALTRPASAVLHAGDVAPDFHKTGLDNLPYTLSQYRGKVVVMFLLGYSCPVCLSDGDNFQNEIVAYYQPNSSVQVLGPDVWNGTPQQLAQFKVTTGATYPLLQQAGTGAGNENLLVPYGEQDNYVVVNAQGVIRYHAVDLWPHGNRYHPNDLKACIDSLLPRTADVGDSPAGLALAAAPNPFGRSTAIELSHPGPSSAHARVVVHDVTGRRVALLWDGMLSPGHTRIEWDGRADGGAAVAPGIYLVSAEVGGARISRRLVRAR